MARTLSYPGLSAHRAGKRLYEIRFVTEYGDSRISTWALTPEDARAQFVRDRALYAGQSTSTITAVQDCYPDLPSSKAEHFTWEECLRRYPRICRLVQDVLIGSVSEAACCLRDYRDGLRCGSEAVSHSGLSPYQRVQAAINHRRWLKAQYPTIYRQLAFRQEAA